MNTINFKWKRFSLYFKQYLGLNWKMWALGAVALIGLELIFYFLAYYPHLKSNLGDRDLIYTLKMFESSAKVVYSIGLFLGGILVTVMSFNDTSSKNSAIFHLSLPATAFEKVLSKWIVTLPLFLIVYQFIWLIMSMIINTIVSTNLGLNLGLFVPVWKTDDFEFIYLIFVCLHAFYFAGTAFFGKRSFIASSLVLIGLWIFLFVYIQLISMIIFSNKHNFNFDIDTLDISSFGLHSNILSWVLGPIWLVFPLCYYLAFQFYKEKEV